MAFSIQCPLCGKIFEVLWAIGIVETPKFCPFCGKEIRERYIELEKKYDA